MTLVLTYHAVEHGPSPICLPPELFVEHARVIARSGRRTVTVSQLAAALQAGAAPKDAVAITFDDGYASVPRAAAHVLAEHGLTATVFCVSGYLGRVADWPTLPPWAPRLLLAEAAELAELAVAGWEIGSHGVQHAPVGSVDGAAAHREVVESRQQLERAVGTEVSSFAWPYGVRPSRPAAALIAGTYSAACAIGPAAVRSSSDRLALPRVDVSYVRDPRRLERALEREPHAYLAVRRAGARLRRVVRPDHGTHRQPA